ncbi:MAG: ABC transporter permease [Calditrichia bacterium]
MFKDLKHFWRINLAVVMGAAVASAVLTGALLVGDSMRGSLKEQTLDRLGSIDRVLIAPGFVREDLATELNARPAIKDVAAITPTIMLSGSAIHGSSRTRATGIQLAGITPDFVQLFYEEGSDEAAEFLNGLKKQNRQNFPSVVINEALQKELGADLGDPIIISFEKPSDIHRESLFGRKETTDVVRSMRLILRHVLPNRGPGRFGLKIEQTQMLTAYVNMAEVQKAVEQQGLVNALLLTEKNTLSDVSVLDNEFAAVANLHDRGITLEAKLDYVIVGSREYVVGEELESAVSTIQNELQADDLPILSYLANEMRIANRSTPYSTVVAIDNPYNSLSRLTMISGEPAPILKENEVLLNSWLADDLKARAGDSLQLTYFAVGAGDRLYETNSTFSVRGVVKMTGLGEDNALVPEYPGISDVGNIRDWDPPFAVDLEKIRPKDETYWDDFRSTPKAFVSLKTGQALWGSRFGQLSTIRLAPGEGSNIAELQQQLETKLNAALSPADLGLSWRPVKAEGLKASLGATDFSQLFISFSFFLIISAAILAGLLFRLGVEQRAGEVGLLLASGYRPSGVLSRFLSQGIVLSTLGAILGLLFATLYARGIIHGLRTLWFEAVGTSFLNFHADPASYFTGATSAVIAVSFAIWITLRGLRKLPIPALLRGVVAKTRGKSRSITLWLGILFLLAGIALIVSGITAGVQASGGQFMGSGFLLLTSGLLLSSWLLRSSSRRSIGNSIAGMSLRNASRNPGRSMLCIALVAVACFMIISVGASRKDFSGDQVVKDSGTGGYRYLAEADIPILLDPTNEEDQFNLGFSDKLSEELNSNSIFSLRLRPGDDASCLNLFQPTSPRILGVTPAMVERGGFQFSGPIEYFEETPWQALAQPTSDESIPAFADAHSAQYILKIGVGDNFIMANNAGEEVKLKLVGLLQTSIFQSELLVSEDNFIKSFPEETGFRYFLLNISAEAGEKVAADLEKTLDDYGLDVVSTTEKLAGFQAVENTYRAVFQTLGALGLLLGTIGLGIVLIRNVIERRSELATMQAFGYQNQSIRSMLFYENVFLIFMGILVGSITAAIAVYPVIAQSSGQIPWLELIGTLLAVVLVGAVASRIAIGIALKSDLIPALRSE